ncbi:MAG: hypothetical protein EON91_09250 [Brevundimonas sp.]|uniref:hypothetical protein n=1 Tax=Brevundimonas sp. TaxID=1871086 RepID=UPI00121BE7FE|nr:hypothetical protein [Brevundimonas sp.]RZJ17441.1 MAG: hypothetical protein EON91_09250 [Brevundimonas sp.]
MVVWLILAVAFAIIESIEPSASSDLLGGLGVLPLFIVLSLGVGYVYGLVPAVLTGAICAWAANHISSFTAWLLAAGLVGFIVTGGAAYLLNPVLVSASILGLVGAAAAVFCAWLVRRTLRA